MNARVVREELAEAGLRSSREAGGSPLRATTGLRDAGGHAAPFGTDAASRLFVMHERRRSHLPAVSRDIGLPYCREDPLGHFPRYRVIRCSSLRAKSACSWSLRG